MRASSPRAVSVPPVADGVFDGPALEYLQQFRPVRRHRSLMRALDVPVANGIAAPPQPETARNFRAMGAEPKENLSTRPDLELVENIARAMQNRPLMRRLANIAAPSAGEANAAFAASPPPLAPVLLAPETPLVPADLAPPAAEFAPEFESAFEAQFESGPETELERMKRQILEAEAWAGRPQSAEWLEKAQRERSRARLHNFFAWMATLAIGGAIIATTALVMQP